MIGEFLKAELHSSRFRKGSLDALGKLGYEENIIDNPNYYLESENEKRERVLGLCRGWPNEYLFTFFPHNTVWFYVSMNVAELGQVYRLKSHQNMSNDERLVAKTAVRVKLNQEVANIDNKLIRSICKKIKLHAKIPPVIMVSRAIYEKKVLIEGHSRSVAYCV